VSSSSRIDLDGADSGVVACKDREEADEITQTTNLQPLPTTARPSSAPATAAGSGEPVSLVISSLSVARGDEEDCCVSMFLG
jgi:hypothetical protein